MDGERTALGRMLYYGSFVGLSLLLHFLVIRPRPLAPPEHVRVEVAQIVREMAETGRALEQARAALPQPDPQQPEPPPPASSPLAQADPPAEPPRPREIVDAVPEDERARDGRLERLEQQLAAQTELREQLAQALAEARRRAEQERAAREQLAAEVAAEAERRRAFEQQLARSVEAERQARRQLEEQLAAQAAERDRLDRQLQQEAARRAELERLLAAQRAEAERLRAEQQALAAAQQRAEAAAAERAAELARALEAERRARAAAEERARALGAAHQAALSEAERARRAEQALQDKLQQLDDWALYAEAARRERIDADKVPRLWFTESKTESEFLELMRFYGMELIVYPRDKSYLAHVDLASGEVRRVDDPQAFLERFANRSIVQEGAYWQPIRERVAARWGGRAGELIVKALIPHRTANYLAWKELEALRRNGLEPDAVQRCFGSYRRTPRGTWVVEITDFETFDGRTVPAVGRSG